MICGKGSLCGDVSTENAVEVGLATLWPVDDCLTSGLVLSTATRRKKVAAGMRDAVQVGLTTQGSADAHAAFRLVLSAATRRKKGAAG